MINKRILIIKTFPWALVMLWMGLIFFFSHQPAIVSNELSTGITEKIVEVISRAVPESKMNQVNLNFIVRKGAHFGVYLVLGVLVANGLISCNRSKVSTILLSLLICVLYAISDEFHQLFIPGRSGEVRDVLLDSAGALVGIVLINVIRR